MLNGFQNDLKLQVPLYNFLAKSTNSENLKCARVLRKIEWTLYNP